MPYSFMNLNVKQTSKKNKLVKTPTLFTNIQKRTPPNKKVQFQISLQYKYYEL